MGAWLGYDKYYRNITEQEHGVGETNTPAFEHISEYSGGQSVLTMETLMKQIQKFMILMVLMTIQQIIDLPQVAGILYLF